MRMFFVLIVVVGVIGSALSNLPQRRSPSPQELVVNVSGDDAASENATSTEAMASNGDALEIPRSPDGHFYADVEINGAKVHMLIDTGATLIALTRDDARSAGLAPSLSMPEVVGEGADGSIHGEVVTIDRMNLGNAKAEAMPAIVLNSGSQSLLGQSFLAKFAAVEIHGDTMTLR